MMEYLETLWTGAQEVLNDPQRLHAALVHLPVAVGVFGLLGCVIFTLSLGRFRALRWLLVVFYGIGMVLAWQAHETGEAAAKSFASRGVTQLLPEAQADLDRHASLGEWVWVPFAVTFLALLLATGKRAGLRFAVTLLALLASIASAGYVGLVGHLGGRLVYVHGVGAPRTPANLNPLPTPTPAPTPPVPSPQPPSLQPKPIDPPPLTTGKTNPLPAKPGKADQQPAPPAPQPKKDPSVVDPGPVLPGKPIFN